MSRPSDLSGIPRVYRVPALLRDLRWVASRLPSLWSIWVGRRLPQKLREQIIVAVAQVNACRMCAHAHMRMALEVGVSDKELAALEGLDEAAFDRRTWLALAYARERTRVGFAPITSPDAYASLVEMLGEQTFRDIEDVAHVMTVANGIANTLNALSDRCHGRPVPGSRFADEVFINVLFLPGAWLGTLIAAIRQRRSPLAVWRQARGFEAEPRF